MNHNLHQFSWDNNNPIKEEETEIEKGNPEDYKFNFGSEEEEEEDQDPTPPSNEEEEEEQEEEDDKPSTKKKPAKKEEYKFDFGGEEEDEDDDEEEEDDKPSKATSKGKEKTEKINSRGVVSFLKDKGYLELSEDTKLEDLSDDEVDDQLEDFIEESNENYFAERIAELPGVAKNLLKIAAQGGDVDKYLKTISSSVSATLKVGLDMDVEKNQELALRSIMAQEGKDADEIEDQIEFLKSKDRLESTAKKNYEKWETKAKKAQEELIEQESTRKTKTKENIRKFRSDITDVLSKTKEVSQLGITAIDKRELPAYIANPAYETGGKDISEFQKDLYEALKDNKKTIALAKILRSGFDFTKLIEKGASLAIKDTKNKIQHQKESTNERTKRTPKRMLDYLED